MIVTHATEARKTSDRRDNVNHHVTANHKIYSTLIAKALLYLLYIEK